jgi:hypothetical protein
VQVYEPEEDDGGRRKNISYEKFVEKNASQYIFDNDVSLSYNFIASPTRIQVLGDRSRTCR